MNKQELLNYIDRIALTGPGGRDKIKSILKNFTEDGAEKSGKSPFVGENGNWYEYNDELGEYVDTYVPAQGPQGQRGLPGPQGYEGPEGPQGPAGPEGPEGPEGQQGQQGVQGIQGETGATPDISIGTVTTGAAGTPASASMTGTPEAPVLNLVIPQGIQGNTGSSVAYPYELVNNETTDDATKGHTAQGAKRLKDQIDQLDLKLNQLGGYLVPLLKKIAYEDNDAKSLVDSIDVLLNTVELTSISAVYTQPGTIYVGEPLDDLKTGLVVTAHYNNGTEVEVNEYTLSGTLTAGTSTITVTYLGETTTFSVIVTDALYYVLGKMMPSKVSARNSVSNSSSYNYGVTIDGVYYFFTNAYSVSSNTTSQKRCCYPGFDLSLTAGKRYKYIIEFTSALTSSQTIQASNAYYDSTYQAAGVANVKQICDYSNNVQASAWGNTTKSGDTVSFEEVAPSGYVGVRTSLKLLSSGTETTWSVTVKRFIIQEVTE